MTFPPETLFEYIAWEYDLKKGDVLVMCDNGTWGDLWYIATTDDVDYRRARQVIDRTFKYLNGKQTI